MADSGWPVSGCNSSGVKNYEEHPLYIITQIISTESWKKTVFLKKREEQEHFCNRLLSLSFRFAALPK